MDQLTDESQFTLTQFFLADPHSEQPTVHQKKKEKAKGTVLKELDTLIHDVKEKELEIDLFPYEEAATYLRKLKGNDAYLVFLDELLAPYQ
ncbi:LtrD [Enterococcus faecalis]|uniref:LtrD n=1 Tax=Enterococcus faecalis TaxID=1351 RepID=UPI0022E0D518|nr:LtrD [Enterococcus faecalis]